MTTTPQLVHARFKIIILLFIVLYHLLKKFILKLFDLRYTIFKLFSMQIIFIVTFFCGYILLFLFVARTVNCGFHFPLTIVMMDALLNRIQSGDGI